MEGSAGQLPAQLLTGNDRANRPIVDVPSVNWTLFDARQEVHMTWYKQHTIAFGCCAQEIGSLVSLI